MQFLQAERPRALQSHQLFHTSNIDDARARVTKVFSAHDLRLLHTDEIVDSHMYHVSLGAISLNRLRYGAAVEVDPGRIESYYLVQMPISGACSVASGHESVRSTPHLASVVTPMRPLRVQWQKGCDMVIIKIDRDLLERHCAQHIGHDLVQPVEFELQMKLKSPRFESWRRLVELLVTEADHENGMLTSPLIHANFEQILSSVLLFSQPNNYSDDLHRPAPPIAPFYVKRAEEYIHAHADEPIGFMDLAKQAGVSVRALYAGFENFRGVSPMAYLRSVRLERVRNELREGTPKRKTVTEVAIRWGFSHLGHFTAAYNRKFGETPSETLRKSCS